MKHQHKYDAQGKQLCCTLEEKINKKPDNHSDDDGHDHNHSTRRKVNVSNVSTSNHKFCFVNGCHWFR